jgi:hypothetical protein
MSWRPRRQHYSGRPYPDVARRARSGTCHCANSVVAAWDLYPLDDPVSLETVRRAWQAERALRLGYKEPLSFRYQAIVSAAGPVAEARIRHAKRYDCLIAGDDFEIIMRSQKRGWANVEETLRETLRP